MDLGSGVCATSPTAGDIETRLSGSGDAVFRKGTRLVTSLPSMFANEDWKEERSGQGRDEGGGRK